MKKRVIGLFLVFAILVTPLFSGIRDIVVGDRIVNIEDLEHGRLWYGYDYVADTVYIGENWEDTYFGNILCREYIVSPKNENLVSINGAVFGYSEYSSKYFPDTLIAYPSLDKKVFYHVPEGVRYISGSAFNNTVFLKTVKLPKTLEYVLPWVFTNSSIEAVTLPKFVSRYPFYYKKGMLFGKFQGVHIPIFYQPSKKKESYTFSDSIEGIVLDIGIFNKNPYLKELIIPNSVDLEVVDLFEDRASVKITRIETDFRLYLEDLRRKVEEFDIEGLKEAD